MQWTDQQSQALRAAEAWLRNPRGPQVFRIFGWAGTGKSTLALEIGKMGYKTIFGAFTGKAALVMRKKGCRGAMTLHSMIYTPEDEGGGSTRFYINPQSPALEADVIVVDEVSMVGADLGQDLLSFNKKVLVLGDPFQLPPIHGAGFFTENVQPDVMLTDIHRQAQDSPIIRLSMDIREGKDIQIGAYGDSKVINRSGVVAQEIIDADQVIVGRNLTRQRYNDRIRELKEYPAQMPVSGDKLICLRNDRQDGLINGQIWRVTEVKPQSRRSEKLKILAKPEDAGRRKADLLINTHRAFFEGREDELTRDQQRQYHHFTFGYAITGHKSQGSQWDNVYLFDESYVFRGDRDRWLYTAITRAAERITIVRG